MNPPTENQSLFGALHDAKTLVGSALRPAEDHRGWIAARGGEGFGEFERQVSGLRVNGSDQVAARNLVHDAGDFMRKWIDRRHPNRDSADRPYLLAVNDAARIWATNLLQHVEALAGQKRSRMNLVQSDKAGGALTVSHVALGDSGAAQLHVYGVEVRERTQASVDTAVALQSQCDMLVEIIGPMTAESLDQVMDRVRKTLAAPEQRLKGVMFVLSATASNLRESLEAFGQEMGSRVFAAQVNLSDTPMVWSEVIGALEALVQSPDADHVDTEAAPLDRSDAYAEEPSSLQDLLRALAQTEGTQWVALVGREPAVHLIETADASTPVSFDAALSMAVLMASEPAHAGTQVKVETDSTITIARVLRETQLGIAVRFARSEVPEPVANLLIERMCTEVESLEEQAQ
jgi:hypothetical protein